MRSRLKRSDFVVISGILWFATGKEIVRTLAAIGDDILGHHKPSTSARPNSTPPAKKQRQRMKTRPPQDHGRRNVACDPDGGPAG